MCFGQTGTDYSESLHIHQDYTSYEVTNECESVSPAYTLGGTSSQNSVFFAICNVDFFQ
jgi:hypothetical protein